VLDVLGSREEVPLPVVAAVVRDDEVVEAVVGRASSQ
jgi:hypothetical protein